MRRTKKELAHRQELVKSARNRLLRAAYLVNTEHTCEQHTRRICEGLRVPCLQCTIEQYREAVDNLLV